MQISGEMKIGETASASWVISRVYGFGLWGMIFVWLAVLVAMLATSTLASILFPKEVSGALVLPIGVLAWIGGMIAMNRIRNARMARALKARGLPRNAPVTFSIDADALEVRGSHGVSAVAWPAVTELLSTRQHWIFVSGGVGYCLPRRLFPAQAGERDFVRSALERMSEAARGRSRQAVSFVQWE